MSYAYQTFTALQVLTAAQMQSLMDSVRDHSHGASSVNATHTGLTLNGTTTIGGLLDASAAAAGQIKFPATQNASSDANTLDDYEEGTWTVTIDSAGGGTGTYSLQAGTYVKKGIEVTAHYNVGLSSKAGYSAGTVSIGGFPFTCQNSGGARGAGAVVWDSLTTAVYTVVMLINSNSTSHGLKTIAAAGTSIGNVSVTDMGDTSGFNGSITFPATA